MAANWKRSIWRILKWLFVLFVIAPGALCLLFSRFQCIQEEINMEQAKGYLTLTFQLVVDPGYDDWHWTRRDKPTVQGMINVTGPGWFLPHHDSDELQMLSADDNQLTLTWERNLNVLEDTSNLKVNIYEVATIPIVDRRLESMRICEFDIRINARALRDRQVLQEPPRICRGSMLHVRMVYHAGNMPDEEVRD